MKRGERERFFEGADFPACWFWIHEKHEKHEGEQMNREGR
jgi:hypothetical protein